MSKGLRNYPEKQRISVIERRIKSKTKGLGYWAAVDALSKVSAYKLSLEVLAEAQQAGVL